jgi:dynein heavy chain
MYLLNKVSTIIYLLEGLLESCPSEMKKPDVIENLFMFAVMWAFGGPMVVDKGGDFRKYFSEAFATTFGQKFPKEKSCFDYMWSFQEEAWVEWTSKVDLCIYVCMYIYVYIYMCVYKYFYICIYIYI